MAESPHSAAHHNYYMSHSLTLDGVDVIDENVPLLLPKTSIGQNEPSPATPGYVQPVYSPNDCCGLWRWYWRHPINYLPVLYYIASLVAVPVLSILWFIEENITFLITGMLTVSMCSYAMYKFKICIELRNEAHSFKQHNVKMKRENQLLRKELRRMSAQREALWEARRLLFLSFQRNEENIRKLQVIEQRMKVFGSRSQIGMDKLMDKTKSLNKLMRQRLKGQQRDMLFAAYHIVERRRTTKQDVGMTDFDEFKSMLPSRMRPSFMKKTDFENLVKDRSIVDYSTFVDVMDLYCMYLVLSTFQ